uniref:DUF4780 domain-containing protein n=1 Tax=Syphacia muris TaxID=451379 RepID=A0A158R4Q1_9BILA
MTDGKHHKCGDGEVLFKRFYLAVALTSLKTLQLLLQRTLKTESNGFTLYFLDVDGKTALNSKWSIRDIGYIFGWDRESILTINFKLKSMPTFNSVESRLPEESVELNIISAPRTNAVQPLNESVNLTATAHSSKNSVKANISLKRKQVTSACKSWQKKHKRVTKILKPETRDDPVLVRRIRYILIHGHPPPDKASCTNSANSNKDAEKKSLKRLSNQATQTVSSLTIRKIGKRCKKLTTITLSSSLKSLPLKMTEETKSLKHNLPNELTDSISKPEVSTQRQAPSTVKQSAVSTRRRVSATNVNSAVSRSPDRSIPASSTSKKCGSSEDIPERSYAFNRKKKRLPASLCAYELRKRRLSPLPLPGLLARTVK